MREWKNLVDCYIARVRTVRRLLYSQGANFPARGKNVRFLESSRRRSFYGEVASKWFGYYSLSWCSGIILTSLPYSLHIIKGEDFSWIKLACGFWVLELELGAFVGLELLAWLEWLWDFLCQDRLWVAIRSMVSESLEQEVCGERRTVGRDLTTSRPWL